jgi:hypothetical protein
VFPNLIIEFMYEFGCEWSCPIVIGHMGVEYNHLGDECLSRKERHMRGIGMG